MLFEQIHLINFKNFRDLRLEAGPGFHFITGLNGVGKTNLLDAIYFISMTRSFTPTSVKDLIKNGADFCRIEAGLSDHKRSHDIEIKIGSSVREWNWDGKPYNALNEHIGKIPVVMIAPDEVYTLMHLPEVRRKYLNQVLIQVDHSYLNHLMAYGRILKQRNAALRQMKSNGRMDKAVLDAIDNGLSLHGQIIFQHRKKLVAELNPMVHEYVRLISGTKQTGHLEYYSDLESQGSFDENLKKTYEKDYFSGRTNLGIHKDKLICTLGEMAIGEQGSQGQLKTFVIALKLAQFKYLKNKKEQLPIVLLDDVFAKLDEQRVRLLIQLLGQEQIEQCFISDTDYNRAEGLLQYINGRSYVYRIEDGLVNKII